MREASAQIGERLTCVVRGGHFWQLGSIASPATKTTGGVILVAFWSKHGLRSDLRVPNLKKKWPYRSKIAGSGVTGNLIAWKYYRGVHIS